MTFHKLSHSCDSNICLYILPVCPPDQLLHQVEQLKRRVDRNRTQNKTTSSLRNLSPSKIHKDGWLKRMTQ